MQGAEPPNGVLVICPFEHLGTWRLVGAKPPGQLVVSEYCGNATCLHDWCTVRCRWGLRLGAASGAASVAAPVAGQP